MTPASGLGLVAIRPFGSLWTWGNNTSGRLGDGTTASKSSPVQIGSLETWKSLSFAGHCAAVKIDGTLWTWGTGGGGCLWSGSFIPRSSPVQVGVLTDWQYVAVGANRTFGIRTDGSLWAGGSNTSGALGLGNTNGYSTPTQVGALTDWLQICSSLNSTYAVKKDGTLWSWGEGTGGQLGLGSTTNYSSPVQIGSDTDWAFVSVGLRTAVGAYGPVYALKKSGALFTWGYNFYGALGLGDTTNRSSPVQVGILTDWKPSFVSALNAGCAKTDGTLWAWGGGLGLGDGTTTSKSSPVQIGSLTDWQQVAFFGGTPTTPPQGSATAIKRDGTLWTWGLNSSGELGLGDTTDRSSPVQVGSRYNAIMLGSVGNVMGAIMGP